VYAQSTALLSSLLLVSMLVSLLLLLLLLRTCKAAQARLWFSCQSPEFARIGLDNLGPRCNLTVCYQHYLHKRYCSGSVFRVWEIE
jgi:hypothetical protein